MKCTESEDEPATTSHESFLQLSCFISQEVKYMLSGIKSVNCNITYSIFVICYSTNKCLFRKQKMQEQLTKQSPTLGRDAVYSRTVRNQI